MIVLALRYRYITKKQEAAFEEFWAREARANATPPVDLNNLSYITIPLDRFPLHFSDDTEVTVIEDELTDLTHKRILNISKKSNTDLKEEYGAANLEALIEIGENYDRLSVVLVDYAKALMEYDRIEDAVKVLEFGVETGTDVRTNYTLLADCYSELGMKDRLPGLREKVIDRQLLLESAVMDHIDELEAQGA